jgi:hypothetical protein
VKKYKLEGRHGIGGSTGGAVLVVRFLRVVGASIPGTRPPFPAHEVGSVVFDEAVVVVGCI